MHSHAMAACTNTPVATRCHPLLHFPASIPTVFANSATNQMAHVNARSVRKGRAAPDRPPSSRCSHVRSLATRRLRSTSRRRFSYSVNCAPPGLQAGVSRPSVALCIMRLKNGYEPIYTAQLSSGQLALCCCLRGAGPSVCATTCITSSSAYTSVTSASSLNSLL